MNVSSKLKDVTLYELLEDLVEDRAPEWAEKIVHDRLVEAIEDELPWFVGRLTAGDKASVWTHLSSAWKAAEEDLERELRERNIDAAGDYLERIRNAEGWY